MKKQETRKTSAKVEECSLTALTWAREGDREKVRPSVETVIAPSNVLILSELISMQALRSIIPYTGKLFIQIQRSLYKDIFRRTDINHQLSEGYDLIQTAACFLCGYMGKKIIDEIIHKGKKMTIKDLYPVHFYKNSDNEYHCPVTYKVFTLNSKIAVIRTSGNVYLYDCIKELNIDQNCWEDLISSEPFTKDDIIILQDPSKPDHRQVSQFFHIRQEDELKKKRKNTSVSLNPSMQRLIDEVSSLCVPQLIDSSQIRERKEGRAPEEIRVRSRASSLSPDLQRLLLLPHFLRDHRSPPFLCFFYRWRANTTSPPTRKSNGVATIWCAVSKRRATCSS